MKQNVSNYSKYAIIEIIPHKKSGEQRTTRLFIVEILIQ